MSNHPAILSDKEKKHRLWTHCLLFSLGTHLAVCFYFYFNPPTALSPLNSLFHTSVAEPKPFADPEDLDANIKNAYLEEAFKTIVVLPPELTVPHDLQEKEAAIALAPEPETVEALALIEETAANFESLIDQKTVEKEAILQEVQELTPSPLFLALEEKARIVSSLQVDDTLSSIKLPFTLPESLQDYEEALGLPILSHRPLLEADNLPSLALEEETAFSEMALEFRSPIEMDLPQIEAKASLFVPKVKTPASLTARGLDIPSEMTSPNAYSLPKLDPKALWNDDFATEFLFTQNPDGKGYLFSITLSPVRDLTPHKLTQNFHFIIDRSASSQKHRFSVFKKATEKALANLSPDDFFNISILDKEITLFSKKPIAATLQNKRLAERFLEKQSAPTLMSGGNIYKLLPSLLLTIPNDDSVYTAILLTDGLLSADTAKKKKLCNKWIEANRGKVNLYTAAVGKENNLLLLDLLSTQSGGKLLYSDTHAAFPRKLAKLVLDLKNPIAKDISITIKAKDTRSHIELYPTSSNLPLIYGNESYTISGKIDYPSSFDLLIQGRHGNEWIGIKKSFSFKQAHTMEVHNIKKLKKMQASLFYDRFLNDGKLSHLENAKKLLNQSQKEISFQ